MERSAVVKRIGFDCAGWQVQPRSLAGRQTGEVRHGLGRDGVLEPAGVTAHAGVEFSLNPVGVLRETDGAANEELHDQSGSSCHATEECHF